MDSNKKTVNVERIVGRKPGANAITLEQRVKWPKETIDSSKKTVNVERIVGRKPGTNAMTEQRVKWSKALVDHVLENTVDSEGNSLGPIAKELWELMEDQLEDYKELKRAVEEKQRLEAKLEDNQTGLDRTLARLNGDYSPVPLGRFGEQVKGNRGRRW